MSYNIDKIDSIITHIKTISPDIFKNNGNEIVICCPFCDDATRKSGKIDHGHCYISMDHPVFNCFRCGTSGTLLKLLINTNYDNQDGIDYISSFMKYNFIKHKNYKFNKTIVSPINKTIDYINEFKLNHKSEFIIFENYIKDRIGTTDYLSFLIYPKLMASNIGCSFLNYDSELVTTRWVNSKYRYTDEKNTIYYFQDIIFENITDIIITEGCFDAINLYLYSNNFNRNSFYISVCGKKYISCIEYLLLNHITIGKYNIHLLFDNDCLDYKKYIRIAKKLIDLYNPKIQIKGWLPTIGKDFSDSYNIKEASC